MFSFHKTLFPYLEQARDYQAKQPSSSTPGFLQTCTCIYIFFKNTHALHHIQYIVAVCGQFGCKNTAAGC